MFTHSESSEGQLLLNSTSLLINEKVMISLRTHTSWSGLPLNY